MKNRIFSIVLLACAVIFGSISFAAAPPDQQRSVEVNKMLHSNSAADSITTINEYTQVVYFDVVATGPAERVTEKGEKLTAERFTFAQLTYEHDIGFYNSRTLGIEKPPKEKHLIGNRARERV